MIRELQIGERALTLSANAGVAFVYRRVFRTDMLTDLTKIKGEELASVEVIEKMAFIMNMMHEKPTAACLSLTETDFLEWLCGFSMNAFAKAEVLTEIVNIWNENEKTTVIEKN